LELDLTVSVRTRYTLDLQAVQAAVLTAIEGIADSVTWDLAYPALEVTPYLPDLFVDLMSKPEHGSQTDWVISDFAPAATDASFIQDPTVDPDTRKLVSAAQVVFHPNFGICEGGAACPFNHQPAFRETSGTDFAYGQTEKVARALAQIAVELANDGEMMTKARAIASK
jgi:hypothetical protein